MIARTCIRHPQTCVYVCKDMYVCAQLYMHTHTLLKSLGCFTSPSAWTLSELSVWHPVKHLITCQPVSISSVPGQSARPFKLSHTLACLPASGARRSAPWQIKPWTCIPANRGNKAISSATGIPLFDKTLLSIKVGFSVYRSQVLCLSVTCCRAPLCTEWQRLLSQTLQLQTCIRGICIKDKLRLHSNT